MNQVWRNGTLTSGDANPGTFPEGARLFETLAVRGGKINCLSDHLLRLGKGLAHLKLSAGPLASGQLSAWREGFIALGGNDGILRLTVGDSFEELSWRPLLPTPPTFRLRTLRTVRDQPEWLPRPKSAPWLNSLAATQELRDLGEPAGVEGLQLDNRGWVSECTRSSIAWIDHQRLQVPAASTGRIPGTTLFQLMEIVGLPIDEVEALPSETTTAMVLLRATFPLGSVPVTHWFNADNTLRWQFNADPQLATICARLAHYRAQKAVSLA